MTQYDMRPLRDKLELEFAEMLAPDLATAGASRVHIVLVSETDLTTAGEFAGLHSPHIHRWLKSYIPGWTGPSPAVLIDDATITRDCGGRWDDMQDSFTGIAVHELGHVACTPGLYARDHELPDGPGNSAQELFAESLRTPQAVYAPALAERSPRHGHEWPFLRACLHIGHRMRQRGIECLWPTVIPHNYYSIGTLASYWRALGDEPTRLEMLPLTLIGAVDPPQTFLDLWRSDLDQWPDV